MGLFSQMSFLALYFYYAYVWKAEKEAVGVILGVSGGICLLAGAETGSAFGRWISGGRSDTTLSTIGNVNWLCGYLSVLLPVGTAVFWGSRREGQNGGKCREGRKGRKWLQAGAGAFTAGRLFCVRLCRGVTAVF